MIVPASHSVEVVPLVSEASNIKCSDTIHVLLALFAIRE